MDIFRGRCERFEDAFASFTGVSHGIAVYVIRLRETALTLSEFEGRRGYHAVFLSYRVQSPASAAKPVLVDIEPETWTMDTSLIESKITSKTKAIMAVHIYGHPVDMDEIFRLSEKYGLKILEDAAEVHGAEYFSKQKGGKWLKCGAMGHAAATSFYANKIVTTGEGA
jgi:perosamine synthetase